MQQKAIYKGVGDGVIAFHCESLLDLGCIARIGIEHGMITDEAKDKLRRLPVDASLTLELEKIGNGLVVKDVIVGEKTRMRIALVSDKGFCLEMMNGEGSPFIVLYTNQQWLRSRVKAEHDGWLVDVELLPPTGNESGKLPVVFSVGQPIEDSSPLLQVADADLEEERTVPSNPRPRVVPPVEPVAPAEPDDQAIALIPKRGDTQRSSVRPPRPSPVPPPPTSVGNGGAQPERSAPPPAPVRARVAAVPPRLPTGPVVPPPLPVQADGGGQKQGDSLFGSAQEDQWLLSNKR